MTYKLEFFRYPEAKPIGSIAYDKTFTVSGIGRDMLLKYKPQAETAEALKQLVLDNVQSPYLYAQLAE